jgi:hypothetical protein
MTGTCCRRQRPRRLRFFLMTVCSGCGSTDYGLNSSKPWYWSDRDRMTSQGLSHLLAMASRRPGQSKTNAEIRDLIYRMSAANPFWGAPRIHGERI